MTVSRQELTEIIKEAVLHLAAQRRLAVAGSYQDILQRVNEIRIARGYRPITLSGLRTSALENALAELGASVFSERGPVVVPDERITRNAD
jgi:hypothetical protein